MHYSEAPCAPKVVSGHRAIHLVGGRPKRHILVSSHIEHENHVALRAVPRNRGEVATSLLAHPSPVKVERNHRRLIHGMQSVAEVLDGECAPVLGVHVKRVRLRNALPLVEAQPHYVDEVSRHAARAPSGAEAMILQPLQHVDPPVPVPVRHSRCPGATRVDAQRIQDGQHCGNSALALCLLCLQLLHQRKEGLHVALAGEGVLEDCLTFAARKRDKSLREWQASQSSISGTFFALICSP
mmetsp:Transcript_4461/g.11128  ORF Transcript_4461/g.11128 Transcript_4461/m.11128 type:complete len:240 (-) Transcript_4461:250-969(-)